MKRENLNKALENPGANIRIKHQGNQVFFEFDAKAPEQARAYNQAINTVLSREGHSPTPHGPFAQGKDEASYQNWETWSIAPEKAQKLLSQIEEEAKRIISEE